MMKQPEPVSMFISYALEDESLRSELEKHLSLLQRQCLVSTWHDREILPGTARAEAIDEHLKSASIILLLVSADFLASDYCYGIEMQRALERHEAGQARVIPIIVRPCDKKGAPFAHLQALPTDAKAITIWNNRDEAWTNVAAGIRRVIEELPPLSVKTPSAGLPPVVPPSPASSLPPLTASSGWKQPMHVPISEPLSPISTNSLPIVQSPPAPSEPATLFVPTAPLMSSSSAITTQPGRSVPPKESEISTPRGIPRRAVLIGAGGVIGVGLVGTGIMWLTRTPALQPSGPQGTLYVMYHGHSSNVYALAWSLDGKRIASGSGDTSSLVSNDHTVQVWDAADGGNVFIYRGHSDTVERVAWSPDGKRIASGSVDKTVQVWDAADGGNVFTYRGHSDTVNAVVWSPDGKRIASGSFDVQVWDAATGGNASTYRGHSSYVYALAWSPDGKRIASGSWDKTVQVWDVATGGNVFTYHGHSDTVNAVAWSPDGKRIASSSEDVQVWDAANGGNVFTHRGQSIGVFAVAWSPDGKRIASSSEDVQVWQA